jgi:hypothetical protein
MKPWLFGLLMILATASPAAADDPFIPLGAYGQFGVGVTTRADDPVQDDPGGMSFDGTFRAGKVWRAHDRVRPGGFFEVRSVGFDTFEAAIGPQVQLRVGDSFGLQLRAGLGGVAEADNYALVGLQAGNWLAGVSVTARRAFDEPATTVSMNVELSTAVLLLPFVFAALR